MSFIRLGVVISEEAVVASDGLELGMIVCNINARTRDESVN